MSMETDFVSVVTPLCPRVFPDVAPLTTAKPYVTYQGFGGQSVRFLDNTPASKRNTLVKVRVWSATRAQALTLTRQIEDALCGALALFQATPIGEPDNTHDDLAMADAPQGLFGCIQNFSIWANR